MQITLNLGRWTKLHTIIAVGGALVLGGAIERATAISPTVPAPIRWAGGVAAMTSTVSVGNAASLYTVPAGQHLMLTDLILSNVTSNVAAVDLFAGDGSCSFANVRLAAVVVPANSSLVIPLVTGIGFAGGQFVCVDTNVTLKANARGFLFVAASPG
jgi:hypothetical protein